MPAHIASQEKCIGLAVVRDLPAFGQFRLRIGPLIESDEAVVNRSGHGMYRAHGGNGRIKVRRLAEHGNHQRAAFAWRCRRDCRRPNVDRLDKQRSQAHSENVRFDFYGLLAETRVTVADTVSR